MEMRRTLVGLTGGELFVVPENFMDQGASVLVVYKELDNSVLCRVQGTPCLFCEPYCGAEDVPKEVLKKSMEGNDINSEVLMRPDKELIIVQASPPWILRTLEAATARFVLHRGAEDALQEHMVDDLRPIILLPDIENQYHNQYEIGGCFGIPRLFSKRDILNSQKQMKYPIAASAAIFAANCQQMQSLKGAGTALGQAALIACTSSWLLTLLLILAFVALPSLSYTKAKLVTGLAAFLTASSHFAFVAMNLGSVTKYTVGMVLLAASVCSAAILYMTCTTKIKSAPAALEGVSTK